MNFIKKKRKDCRLSQKDVAAACEVVQSTVAMWETGKSVPRAGVLIKLARLFDCTVDELLGVNPNK